MRIGDRGFIGDAMFTQVTSSVTLPGPNSSSVDLGLGAGLRFWNHDNRLKIAPGALNVAIVHSEALVPRQIAILNDVSPF